MPLFEGHSLFDQFDVSACAGNPTDRPSRLVAASHPLYQKRNMQLVSEKEVACALRADATSAKIMAKGLRADTGSLYGVRLNLNVFKSQGIAVQTIHAGNASGGHRNNRGFYNGSVVTYARAVLLSDAFFTVSQSGREKIASGTSSKYPIASVDGLLQEAGAICLDGIEIRFNPKSGHLFTDLEHRPVRWCSEVTVYGHRAFGRGMIEYYTSATAPPKVGNASTNVLF